jgi:hypothetical protein
MTPEERELVTSLFTRLAELERTPRDAEAERLIHEGLSRAPNAVYSLVQTVLLQDEALRSADDHIAQLEDAAKAQTNAGSGSFLGARPPSKWNTGSVLHGTGSVPSVGSRDEPMGVPPGYERDRGPAREAYRDAPQSGPYGAPQQAGYGGPSGAAGGGFLGTAAAIAAGAIGGGLLLNGIRSALGGQGQGGQDKGPFSNAFDHLTGSKADASGTGGSGDLARDAGLSDIGKSNAFGAADLRGSSYDNDDSDLDDDSIEEEEDFSDDAFDDDDI